MLRECPKCREGKLSTWRVAFASAYRPCVCPNCFQSFGVAVRWRTVFLIVSLTPLLLAMLGGSLRATSWALIVAVPTYAGLALLSSGRVELISLTAEQVNAASERAKWKSVDTWIVIVTLMIIVLFFYLEHRMVSYSL